MAPKPPARERAWGTRYDTLQSSPPSPPLRCRSIEETMNHGLSAYTPSETPSAVTTPASDSNDSQLRDASIFVGSLPTSFTQAELTQRLTDHLSGHIPIKATKVVRDSRGGVCAFIQCENPGAVSSLLQELRMHPPRPFHGRFLRFEAAKAFRTILISYRIPAGVRAADSDADDPFHSPNGNRFGNLKLPHAMRIFQPSNSRHLGILYDAEALALSGSRAAEDLEFHANPLSTEEGLLISPLKYDEETIKRVVTAFGPLESFKECSTNLEVMKGPVPSNSYPHDGPRSTEMSKGVWEVKWKDREHSVAALQTLRRLPFLTLTWAHHPPSVWGFRKTENSHARSSWSPPPARQGPPGLRIPRALEDRFSSPVASPSPPPALATSSVIIKATAAMVSTPSSGPTASSKESSTTSSPLLGFGCDANSPGGAHTCWADQVAELDALTDSIGCTPSSPKHALLTTTDDATDALSSLNLPTPGGRVRALAPATPNMARAQQVPSDARTRPAVMASRDSQCGPTSEMMGDRDLDALPLSPAGPPSRDIDPKTIFVGGLSVDDADEWNEHRLRGIFNRYGAIDNIQVVRSLHKRTCFAFVQFVNPDFASRAVQAEHNQVHHGRHLRVQLRERVALRPRTDWRVGRGRGRSPFGGSLRSHQNAPGFGSVVAPCLDAVHAPDIRHVDTSANADPLQLSLQTLGETPLRRRESYMSAHNSTSSVSSDTTKVPSVQYETSNGPSSATTSSPATSAPSRASTTAPLPPPPPPPPMNVGYFIPPPWVQPYPPPYSYPVPVVAGYAHPGYAYPHIPAMQSAVLAQAATAPTAMSGSRGSLAPASVEPTNKLSSAGEGETQSSPQSVMQPPLRATGFIQNEQGTLIPVYQREALDQYMANAHNAEPLPQSTSVPGQGPPSAATNLTLWPTPPFPVYAGTYPVAANSVHHPCFPHPPQQGPWLPGGPAYGMAPFPPADPRAFSRPFSAAGIAPRPMRGPPQVAQVPNQPPYGRPGGYSPSLRRYNKRDDQLRGGGRPTASG